MILQGLQVIANKYTARTARIRAFSAWGWIGILNPYFGFSLDLRLLMYGREFNNKQSRFRS